MANQAEIDAQLADLISETYADPLGFAMLAFPWDTDSAIQVVDWENEDVFVDTKTGFCYDERQEEIATVTYKVWMESYRERFNSRFGPDRWACEWLDEVGREVSKRGFNGTKAVAPIQFATSSGHGIGKSTLVAWVILWIMSTRPFAKGTVTANTAEQLRVKTWAELGKWHKRSIVSHWFKYNSGRGNMNLRHIKHEEEWYCSAQTCREENAEAFAGQHAANSTSFYIFDEASGVPNKIYEVREGGTTDGEPMVFDFGNPTRNSGRFFDEVEGTLKHRFIARIIDSRTVVITNKVRIAEWLTDYGEDSDFARVRVRGIFPSASSLQFIPSAWVKRAMMREQEIVDRFAPVTIGVDVARFGDDDSVIYPIVGDDARSFAPTPGDGIYNGLDNVQLAQKVIAKIEFFRDLGVEVSGVFIDGTGNGSGVVDVVRHSGYNCVDVNFGTTPVFEPEVYRYRSDEMWGRLRESIKNSLILPATLEFGSIGMLASATSKVAGELYSELTTREFGYTLQGGKIHLETKKDMKARKVRSPNISDALALNKAQDVSRMDIPHGQQTTIITTNYDFDPIANVSVG